MPTPVRLRIEFPAIERAASSLRAQAGLLDVLDPAYELLRAEDLLHLRVQLQHLTRTAGRWQPTHADQPGVIVFHFPPQHVVEYAVESTTPTPPATVASYLALPSRVAIEVPAGAGVTDTVQGFLDALATYPMRLSASARGLPIKLSAGGLAPAATAVASAIDPSAERPRPPELPEPDETAIELPWRLILSPTPGLRWVHRSAASTAAPGGRHELWHTRLETATAADRTARALWTRDPGYGGNWNEPTTPPPSPPETDASGRQRVALTRTWRKQIVAMTSDQRVDEHRPAAVDRLMLTALGGWLDVHGRWPSSPTGLLGWDHRATLGRDQFVRIEQEGWLWPFGHRASLVTITERKLDARAPGKAFLWQRQFIRILERHQQWTGRTPREDRGKPFVAADVTVRETPDIVCKGKGLVTVLPDALVPKLAFLGGRAYGFPLAAVDRDDAVLRFEVPLIFVGKPPPNSPASYFTQLEADCRALYAELGDARRADLRGRRVALAPSRRTGGRPGEAQVETAWMVFTAVIAGELPIPQLDHAGVAVEAIRALTGSADPVTVDFHDAYLTDGLPESTGKNPAEVFLRLVDAARPYGDPARARAVKTGFAKATDKVGGFLAPELAMSGLSRKLGPISGTASALNTGGGAFDPAKFFADVFDQAKLFGTFNLAQVVATGLLANAPWFVADVPDPRTLTLRYGWSTKLRGFPATNPIFQPAAATRLALAFEHIDVKLVAGKKPELDVKLTGLDFRGPLAFVDALRAVIPFDGFSDPPALAITPQGIDATFSMGLPNLAIGVFSLTGVSLSAGFSIPFLGATPLSVRFGFCSRDNPFTLTVSMLGGGGFFAIEINPQGIQALEAALEFGACLAIDLGVASGSVSIMAGIYFQVKAGAAELTGYFRLRGEVDVLGLISASIELYLALTYEAASGKVIGRAVLEIDVSIMFLSFTVTIEMEKRFAGSAGDPTFLEVLAPAPDFAPWNDYLAAFAEAG